MDTPVLYWFHSIQCHTNLMIKYNSFYQCVEEQFKIMAFNFERNLIFIFLFKIECTCWKFKHSKTVAFDVCPIFFKAIESHQPK